jgi:hypothetical protein
MRFFPKKVLGTVRRLTRRAPGRIRFFDDKTILLFKNRNGSIEHYYHFLFGCFFPLIHFLEEHDGPVVMRDAGPLTRLLIDYDDPRIHIIPWDLQRELFHEYRSCRGIQTLWGYDNRDFYDWTVFQKVREVVFRRLQAQQSSLEQKFQHLPEQFILFIDRGEAPPFYRVHKKYGPKSAGRDRRSTPNLKEVVQQTQSSFPSICVELESMPFWDQVYLFRRARMIVGQHGAGLSNWIWAENSRSFIEITGERRETKTNFRALANVMQQPYDQIIAESNHPILNAEVILRCLEKHWSSASL